jgi:hypothetical protein
LFSEVANITKNTTDRHGFFSIINDLDDFFDFKGEFIIARPIQDKSLREFIIYIQQQKNKIQNIRKRLTLDI